MRWRRAKPSDSTRPSAACPTPSVPNKIGSTTMPEACGRGSRTADVRLGQASQQLMVADFTLHPHTWRHTTLRACPKLFLIPVLIATSALLSLGRLTGFLTDPVLRADGSTRSSDSRHRSRPPPCSRSGSMWSHGTSSAACALPACSIPSRRSMRMYLLQEVDRHCDRSNRRDVAADLEAALGMNWIFAGEFQEIGRERRAAQRTARPGDSEWISAYRRRRPGI